MRKYYANANMLLRKFSYCSPDVKCCTCMLKSYCATMYCFTWFDSTVTSIKTLKIVYNNGLNRKDEKKNTYWKNKGRGTEHDRYT